MYYPVQTTTKAAEAVQKLDCGDAEFVPHVVHPLNDGGADFGPELHLLKNKQGNKIQENRGTRPCKAAATVVRHTLLANLL